MQFKKSTLVGGKSKRKKFYLKIYAPNAIDTYYIQTDVQTWIGHISTHLTNEALKNKTNSLLQSSVEPPALNQDIQTNGRIYYIQPASDYFLLDNSNSKYSFIHSFTFQSAVWAIVSVVKDIM